MTVCDFHIRAAPQNRIRIDRSTSIRTLVETPHKKHLLSDRVIRQLLLELVEGHQAGLLIAERPYLSLSQLMS